MAKIKVDFTHVGEKDRKLTLPQVAAYFDNVKFRYDCKSFKCECPSHMDNQNSLNVTQADDGSILLKCHAGCSAYDIMEEVGLTRVNLGTAKERNCSWYGDVPLSKKGDKVVNHYDYLDENGAYLFTKVRIKTVDKEGKTSKRFIFGTVKNNKFKMSSGTRPRGIYNIQSLYEAKNNKDFTRVYIAEGEKDVDTLTDLGFLAVTAGGAESWASEYNRHFKGCIVYILRDNDDSGLRAANRIKRQLKRVAHRVYVVNPSDKEKGDISDFIEELGNVKREEKIQRVKEIIAQEESLSAPKDTYPDWQIFNEKGKPNGYDLDVLAQCIIDTMNLVKVKPDRHSDFASIYYYSEEDGMYHQFLGDGSSQYAIRSYQIMPHSKYEETIKNILVLLSGNSRVLTYDNINSDPKRVLFRNGIYNLETDELEPFSPDHVFTRRIDVDYIPLDKFDKDEGKVFRKFLKHLVEDPARTKKDKIKIRNILLETVGMILSNVPCYYTKKCILMTGKGNTGKSKMKELVARLLESDGVNYTNASELSEIEINKFIRGDLAREGVRMAGADDMSALSLSDVSTFKSLTGGGQITAEHKGEDPFTFTFKGFFWMCMNAIPKMPKDDAVYDRMLIIKCNNVVTKEERDPKLMDKLLEEKEYIVSLCMKHLRNLIDRDYVYDMCEAVETEITDYIAGNDDVYQFFGDTFVASTGNTRIKMRDAYDKYIQWRKDNGYKSMPAKYKDFTTKVQEKYLKARIKPDGTKRYPMTNGYPMITGYRVL